MAISQRAAIVGASSLLGKEIAEQLNQATSANWDFTLLDAENAAGQMAAAGDEAYLIQPLSSESFSGVNVVFFAADQATTREHWKHAIAAGAAVVDLTGELSGTSQATVRAPLLAGTGLRGVRLDLATESVAAAHPVSLMLAGIVAQLERLGQRARISATVLLPASEQGKAGMDELQAQTVALLSFQTLPSEIYDTQITFNLSAELGSSARVDLHALEAQIAVELKGLLKSQADGCAFRCIQAPVFHGCSASIFLQFEEPVQRAALQEALQLPGLITFPAEDEPSPSNAKAGEQETMQATLKPDTMSQGKGFWLWLVADNLHLQTRNAIACANELLAMRPAGRVQ